MVWDFKMFMNSIKCSLISKCTWCFLNFEIFMWNFSWILNKSMDLQKISWILKKSTIFLNRAWTLSDKKLKKETKKKRNKNRIEPSKYTENLKRKTVKSITKPSTGWKHHSTWVSLLQNIALGRCPLEIPLSSRGFDCFVVAPS